MLYTRLFGGSCVSEHRILISIGGLSLWSVDILHQSYPEMLNALGVTQQHNGYTEIIGIYKLSWGNSIEWYQSLTFPKRGYQMVIII